MLKLFVLTILVACTATTGASPAVETTTVAAEGKHDGGNTTTASPEHVVAPVLNNTTTTASSAAVTTVPAEGKHDGGNTTTAEPAVSQDVVVARAVSAAAAPLLQIIQFQAQIIFNFIHPQNVTNPTLNVTKDQHGNLTSLATPSPSHIPDRCKLRPENGICQGKFDRWYYDTRFSQCYQFVYGGCEGNENRFETAEECARVCNPEPVPTTTATHVLQHNTKTQENDPICRLRPEPGTCTARLTKYYYNEATRECLDFAYGGCDGNDNRFDSIKECESRCKSSELKDRQQVKEVLNEKCRLRPEPGTCTARLTKYYYNEATRECLDFAYGGCDGNDNRFDSIKECESSCKSSSELEDRQQVKEVLNEICRLRPEPGTCTARLTKYYYNEATRECLDFAYGGCDGNDNRFDSIKECESSCKSSSELEDRQQVKEVLNEICRLRPEPGTCTARLTKYYYNEATRECLDFAYGGCDGNDNRFDSIKECESRCKSSELKDRQQVKEVLNEKCRLRPEPGTCTARLTKYYYNEATRECLDFAYGGCDGNDNRFDSIKECESSCKSSSELEDRQQVKEVLNEICRLRPEPGTCTARLTKYYYNEATRECLDFAYGGCDGNDNRFDSIKECESSCKSSSELEDRQQVKEVLNEICRLRPEPGTCTARLTKYYYNEATRECLDFAYGGCDGNDNRFDSIEACKSACGPRTVNNTTTTLAPEVPINTTTQAPEVPINTTTQAPEVPINTTTQAPGPLNYVKTQIKADCSTPLSLAPCGTNQTAFYFNDASSSCKAALIGGCGYPNAYYSEESCERNCGAFRDMDVCRAEVEPGPCYAEIPKYFFDAATGSCSEYKYGGCLGGPNRFSTVTECNEICKSNITEVAPPSTCTDDPRYAQCSLIVQSDLCSHKLYEEICCKSCVQAGQLTKSRR